MWSNHKHTGFRRTCFVSFAFAAPSHPVAHRCSTVTYPRIRITKRKEVRELSCENFAFFPTTPRHIALEITVSSVLSRDSNSFFFFIDVVPGRRLQRHELRHGRAIEWNEKEQSEAQPRRARLSPAEQVMDDARVDRFPTFFSSIHMPRHIEPCRPIGNVPSVTLLRVLPACLCGD